MKKINNLVIAAILIVSSTACNKSDTKADGYGNFEAITTIISSESNGKLLAFDVNEGDQLAANTKIGYTDTTQLHLKKEQIWASKKVIKAKSQGVLSQINVFRSQLKTAKTNQSRLKKMFQEHAATQQQLDDVQGKIDVLNQQIRSIKTQNSTILNELESTETQVQQLDDQIEKSQIINPIKGEVLVKYVEPHEVVNFGKPLYKIADLSTLQLRVFISETQLANIKLGQEVTVKIDQNEGTKDYVGKISWIASEAEFTPKIIQTKEERVNLVYAVKVDVKNDGSLKIGMPGEMWINQ